MKLSPSVLCLAVVSLIGSSMGASAADIHSLVGKFRRGDGPINETSTSVLLPFAMSWDAVAATGALETMRARRPQYGAFVDPGEDRLIKSVEALAQNPDALDFFDDPDTEAIFKDVYDRAAQKGSPVGMIPYDDAKLYWMVSRAIAAGPDAIAAYSRDKVSPEWCLPPLIRCLPPRPVPRQ